MWSAGVSLFGTIGLDHAQVTAAQGLLAFTHRFSGGRLGARGRPRRFTYGVGERLQVVAAGTSARRLDREPDHLPTTRGGQALGMHGAQVVTVRFHVSGERTENGGGVGVDVREREYGGLSARGAGTASNMAHSVRLYAFTEGHASIVS